MKLTAILCDFDGTLVNRNVRLNPNVKNLISKIRNKGVYFSLATGRAYYGQTQKILAELDIFGYHIFHGGALIFNNKNNKTLWSVSISNESVNKIVKYLKSAKVIFSLESADLAYMSKVFEFPVYAEITEMKPLSKLLNSTKILKMLIFAGLNGLTESQIEYHKEKISLLCNDVSLNKFRYLDHFGLDITSEKATKHTAVLEYEKLLKIPRNQIVAIGDGYNDYPLLTACGYKIAMGNAPKELKEIADFIAPPVDKNGTENALQHIISKFNL